MAETIRLHELQTGQGLPSSVLEQARRRRLHYFAGRSLGEDEFSTRQAYVEGRLEELLDERPAGIVDGFAVGLRDSGDAATLHVSAGFAIGGDGRAIRLHSDLEQLWVDQIADYAERRATRLEALEPVHGVYFLTARREVKRVDRSAKVDPCNRTEVDPLRDERLETVCSLSLQPIVKGDEIVEEARENRERTINRILASLAAVDPFDRISGSVPIAMVAVRSDELLWLDAIGGALPSASAPVLRALMAHTQSVWSRVLLEASNSSMQTALEGLQLDYLPSAGELPLALLSDFTGVAIPKLAWLPELARLELVPVPESGIDSAIQRESARGVASLAGSSSIHWRLLLSIPEAAYRADLLDLPEADHESENDVYRQGAYAHAAWESHHLLYQTLFGGLSAEERERLAAPEPPHAPVLPSSFFEQLLGHDWGVGEQGATHLPAPYRAVPPSPPSGYSPPSPLEEPATGLLREMLDLEAEIERVQAMGEALDKLLSGFRDMGQLQRQHFDQMSVFFTRLASGLPGDGSGLGIARLLPSTSLKQFVPPEGSE